jgi:hypothetical protein
MIRLLVAFAIARLALGAVVLVLLDRSAVAWSVELTAIVTAAFLVYVAVALALRAAGARRDVS